MPSYIVKFCSHDSTNCIRKIADFDTRVPYAGSFVSIKKGDAYWETPDKKVVIGWHGSYNPPCDMDGNARINMRT